MSNQAEAVAIQQDALPVIGDEPKAIEFEIPADPPKEDEKKVEEEPAPKKRGRPPANVIISDLKNREKDLLTSNERLMQELEIERRKSAELSVKATESTHQNMALLKAKLKGEADSARKDFTDAFNSQDAAKQADATAKLARAEHGLADVESWEVKNPEPKAQEPQKPEPRRQEPQQVQYNAATQEWINENTWFSPMANGRPNPDFNKTMHMYAVAAASEVEDQMMAENRAKDISGPEYWERVMAEMQRKFPDQLEGGEEEDVVIETPKPKVASVVRGSPPPKSGSPQKISLTPQERAIVDSMRSNGAMVYPHDHADPKIRGQRMSERDAYITYWKNKQSGAA